MQTQEQHQPPPSPGPNLSLLPWAVATAALVVFLLTLNHWASASSVMFLSRVAGGEWMPTAYAPLSWLVTQPLRLLPAAWQPLALNVFAAALAAATLGLLARSVQLLPHDRTKEQRRAEQSEHSLLSARGAWIAPVLAALACGLQSTFWENATAFTGEMLDAFVLTFCIWSLLEYRLDRREGRLFLLAFAFGLGTPNNYALIAIFPAFTLAIAWTMERQILRFGFVARMLLCGLLGLSLYLLLPALNSAGDATFTFWPWLKANLSFQKMFLLGDPKGVLLRLGVLVPLLSVLLMAIRWPSSLGETSQAGLVLTSVMFRVMHAVLLIVCGWVAFDPAFSPRAMNYPYSFLSIYLLSALAIGYFAGYFVLIGETVPRAWQRMTRLEKTAKTGLTWAMRIALVVLPLGLIVKNLPAIRATNGPALRDLIRLKTAVLPTDGAIVLGDDPVLTRLTRTALRGEGRDANYVVLDTGALPFPAYHRHVLRSAHGRWPDAVTTNAPVQFDSPALINLLVRAAQSNAIYYLHPSFGYYFEAFYLVPRGAAYRMELFKPGTVAPPPLTKGEVDDNNAFWQRLGPTLRAIADTGDSKDLTHAEIARDYARAIDHWGVTLQRLNQVKEAGEMFSLALRVNPDNVAALVNQQFNRNLQAGRHTSVELGKPIQDLLGKYRTWDAALGASGPLDEPALLYRLGQTLAGNLQFHQAAVLLQRVIELEPQNVNARFAYADALLQANLPNAALGAASEIHSNFRPLTAAQQAELVRVEAWSFFRRGDFTTAESLLENTARDHPTLEGPLETLSQMYLLAGRFTNALATMERQLKLSPNNVRTLLNKGALAIQNKDYAAAVPPLDLVLQLQPENQAALMNRAIAHLLSGNLNAAERDYQALRALAPRAYAVHYGLGEIAWKRNDSRGALSNYQEYLKFAPSNSTEHAEVVQRVSQLKGKK
ncbi:MAG: tetratricopeptide repeat protein [Verrucomicrobia bacterium]|nr:tetratricopeptide repeat protein [Verrucomicrobiota bacterium]